jgi:hypothetical protein
MWRIDRKKHKVRCYEPGARERIPLRLVERALAVTQLDGQICPMGIYALELLNNPDTAEHELVQIVTAASEADLTSYPNNMLTGKKRQKNAQVCLRITKVQMVDRTDPRIPEHILQRRRRRKGP